MIALDTTFLLDYLDGVDAVAEYLDTHRDKPFFAPTLALFEVYRGGARTGGLDGLRRVTTALEWIDPLPLDDPGVREGALVEAELLDRGEPVNLGDVLIAGVCRHHGARLVTRHRHFDRIDGLEVETY